MVWDPALSFGIDQVDDVDVGALEVLLKVRNCDHGLPTRASTDTVSYSFALSDRGSFIDTTVIAKTFPAIQPGFVDAVVHVELVEHGSVVVPSFPNHRDVLLKCGFRLWSDK